jgi:acyl-CoA dehydrogenase
VCKKRDTPFGRRSVFDADHEALRESVARFLATADPGHFFGAAAELGFVGLADEDVRFRAVVLEEAMNAGHPSIALALAMHDSFALPLLAGRETAGLAAVVDEGDVRVDGDALTGSADAVVNGLGADVLIVRARTDDGSDAAFVVTGSDVDRVPGDELLGLSDLDVADLRFTGVPATPIDVNFPAARGGHQLALAVAAVAGARTALRTTVDYVQQRKAFGKPIASFENTRHTLGALGAQIAAVESFVDSCLVGNLSPERAAAAKLTATELLGAAVDQGVQLHGGYGYMWEYPIARAYAAARFFRVHGGAGEHLSEVLAGSVGL